MEHQNRNARHAPNIKSKMRPPPPPPPQPLSSSHSNFLSSLKQVEKRLKPDSTIPLPTSQPPSFPIPPPPLPFCSNFFSSLNQVEKRLKLDSTIPSTTSKQSFLPPIPPPPPPPPDSIYTATQSQSLGSAIYLNFDQPTADSTNSSALEDSEPPPEFQSNNSLDFPPTQPQSNSLKHPQTTNSVTKTGIEDIDMLMELLGLSDSGRQEPGRICSGLNCVGDGSNSKDCDCDCDCDDVFYTKIVGARGPKCGKELERLNGWINHFLGDGNGNGDERREPFRLVHLLLAKAAFLSHESGELECFDFPSTVDDFLQNNPPAEVE